MLRLPGGGGAGGWATGAWSRSPRNADQDSGILPAGAHPSLFYFDQFFRQGFDTFYTRTRIARSCEWDMAIATAVLNQPSSFFTECHRMYGSSVANRLRVEVKHWGQPPNPYTWEIFSDDKILSVENSRGQFGSWEEASQAGRKALQRLSASKAQCRITA